MIRPFLIIALLFLAFPVQAQVLRMVPHQCAPEKDMSAALKRIGEKPVGFSSAASNSRFVFWKSEHSWTMVHTDRNGESCITGSGGKWMAHVPGRDA